MSEVYKIFTIGDGYVKEGCTVASYTTTGGAMTIPAVMVGQTGRGRKLGVLPVQLLPDSYKEWEDKGSTTIKYATIDKNPAGHPILVEHEGPETTTDIIVVFWTPIGFRGYNTHTGDRIGWKCEKCGAQGKELEPPETCPQCGAKRNTWFGPSIMFADFPAKTILVEGRIAQGDAGRMGSGTQMIAIMPANVVFRTGIYGRRYGAPSAYYYKYVPDKGLLIATWEDRILTGIF